MLYFEASLGGKWLELLSEIAPGLKRAKVNPHIAAIGPTQVRKRLSERRDARLQQGIVFVERHEYAARGRPAARVPRAAMPPPRRAQR